MISQARTAAGLTPAELTRRIGSSRSRVAKMEDAGRDVSIDLICKALLAVGV